TALGHDQTAVGAFDTRAAGATGGPKGWLLRLAARRGWKWVGRALQVQQRFSELRGNDLAASVTLQAFLALFPLLLVAIAVLGYLNANSADFTDTVIKNLGLKGTAAQNIRETLQAASHSRRASTIVGLLGLAWSGLGVTNALRSAYDRAWQVQDRGMRDKLVGLLWLVGAALIFAASIAATTLVRFLPGVLAPVGIVVGLLVSFALFLWTGKVLADVDVGWRALVPGAVLGAIGLEVLKALGAFLVPNMVASASALYGALGVLFAVLAWLLLLGRLVVYTAVLNVVLYEAKQGTVASTVQLPRHARATREANRSGLSIPDAPSATA
ncbi:MAG: rane protein, partial [Actinomycetota bacterium]|nr:rane protein [Actinomycetota bacterium]